GCPDRRPGAASNHRGRCQTGAAQTPRGRGTAPQRSGTRVGSGTHGIAAGQCLAVPDRRPVHFRGMWLDGQSAFESRGVTGALAAPEPQQQQGNDEQLPADTPDGPAGTGPDLSAPSGTRTADRLLFEWRRYGNRN